jgi:uncharacterized membrane protein YbaN (DUF454 family)
MSEAIGAAENRISVLRSPRRLTLAALGVVCVGLAFAGVFVPGLPTTVFLIAASYLFTRSCPWLEERLVRARVFRPFLPYVRGDRPMPTRARVMAIVMMWAAVSISVATLATRERWLPSISAVILVAAVVGTIVILRVRRAAAR